MEAGLGKWTGYAIWDSGTPRVMQLAGKFGQQTRMVITTDFQRKVSWQIHVSAGQEDLHKSVESAFLKGTQKNVRSGEAQVFLYAVCF